MWTVRLGASLLALAAIATLLPARAADPAGDINIAVVQSMFRETSPALAKVLARPLIGIITRQTGLTGGNVDVAPDALALADQLKAGKCQLGVFHGFEFAWARKHDPNLIPLVVTVYPTGHPRACIVVHRGSKATSVRDLKGERITVARGSRGHCYLYLDSHPSVESARTAPANAEEALSQVVDGRSTATVVDAAALVGFSKLQPGAFQNLRVLAESERFPQNVIAYHKDSLTDVSAAKLRTALVDCHSTSAGKPLMMLWNIVKFDPVPSDYESQLDKVAKAYPCPARNGGTTGTGGR
jgi:ABC-type phosphate/phosphonate transport system substrate-binding protein